MDDQRIDRKSSRIGGAIRGFFGTVPLGVLLFGVPAAIYGTFHAVEIAHISGMYPDKSGTPITSMGELINITSGGIIVGVAAAFIPAVFVGIRRLIKSSPTN